MAAPESYLPQPSEEISWLETSKMKRHLVYFDEAFFEACSLRPVSEFQQEPWHTPERQSVSFWPAGSFLR
jgi:hypothetical protein